MIKLHCSPIKFTIAPEVFKYYRLSLTTTWNILHGGELIISALKTPWGEIKKEVHETNILSYKLTNPTEEILVLTMYLRIKSIKIDQLKAMWELGKTI